MLTLRPDFRGKGRRASNLPGIGQDGEDGWLQGGQDEENLEGGEQQGQGGPSGRGTEAS